MNVDALLLIGLGVVTFELVARKLSGRILIAVGIVLFLAAGSLPRLAPGVDEDTLGDLAYYCFVVGVVLIMFEGLIQRNGASERVVDWVKRVLGVPSIRLDGGDELGAEDRRDETALSQSHRVDDR